MSKTEKMLNEVRAISRENRMDLDRAFDMFRSNCENGCEKYRGTGTYSYAEEVSDAEFGELRRAVLAYDRRNAEAE